MFGIVEWAAQPQRWRSSAEECSVMGLRFYCVKIYQKKGTPEILLRRRADAAARQLHRAGITRAVFPEDFQELERFSRCGITPFSPLPLLKSVAAPMVQAVMTAEGLSSRTAVLAVCGDRLSTELQRTVTELCMHNRYVLLSAPDRDGSLCRRLRREYGASLVKTDDAERIGKADVIVLFDPIEGLDSGEATVLSLYEGGTLPQVELRLPEEKDCRIPSACSRLQMLAALFEAGALRPEQLEVTFCRKTCASGANADGA